MWKNIERDSPQRPWQRAADAESGRTAGGMESGRPVKCLRARRGSLAVEAAIFLPLFIVGILTLGYLVRFAMIEEGVCHALTDETHKLAAEMAVIPFPITYKNDLAERIEQEGRGEVTDISIDPLRHHFPGVGPSGKMYTDLIGVSASYRVPLKLPHIFRSEIFGEETVLCRAFVGTLRNGTKKPFSEMEQEEEDNKVWIFPRAGTRYHGEHCSYIQNEPKEVLLSNKIRNSYSPCELCHPESARDGALVYCFPASGRAYHTGECHVVERYVISIDEEDAKKQGYSACSKCGGH